MTNHLPETPYGSARDLPSVREMEQQIATFRLLGFLLSRDQRKELKRLQGEYRRIVNTVDGFYALLGPRNWVFTSDLNLEAITKVIFTQDPTIAEQRLIEYYKTSDHILFPLRQLNRFDEMRTRIPLLQKALADYEAGRFYSTILVLLTVMDGFVNELDTAQRKGLHARSPEDMVAWDSVVGHHLGLSHAHQSFIKGHYKTNADETTELARNGIMHGTLVNYDNEVVATKAWNRLFAVADWADSRRRQTATVAPRPTFRVALARWREVQADKARLAKWEPHEHEKESFSDQPSELVTICADFLERWSRRQWGPMGQHFMQLGFTQRSVGQLAEEAKSLYQNSRLEQWEIIRVRHVEAAVAYTDVRLTVNGELHQTDLRWVRIDERRTPVPEWQAGSWSLSQYGSKHFLTSERG